MALSVGRIRGGPTKTSTPDQVRGKPNAPSPLLILRLRSGQAKEGKDGARIVNELLNRHNSDEVRNLLPSNIKTCNIIFTYSCFLVRSGVGPPSGPTIPFPLYTEQFVGKLVRKKSGTFNTQHEYRRFRA